MQTIEQHGEAHMRTPRPADAVNADLRRRYLAAQAIVAGTHDVTHSAACEAARELTSIADQVFAANEGLIRYYARPFLRPGATNDEDYLQAAAEGCWQAFRSWDPE